jgi:hypothetical protein
MQYDSHGDIFISIVHYLDKCVKKRFGYWLLSPSLHYHSMG